MERGRPDPARGGLDPVVRWELGRLAKLGILEDGEIICEVQDVSMDKGPGALILTDLRIVALRTGVIRRRSELVSLPLLDVKDVEAGDSKLSGVFGRGRGALSILARDGRGREQRLDLERIVGGRSRAEEIARSIVRQRNYLEEQEIDVSQPDSSDDSQATDDSHDDVPARISVGRGVAAYVNQHGGRLYVWGTPLGRFQWMRAGLEPPQGHDFVHYDQFDEFELYVSNDVGDRRRLRLARRWWPLGGVVVDTGIFVGG